MSIAQFDGLWHCLRPSFRQSWVAWTKCSSKNSHSTQCPQLDVRKLHQAVHVSSLQNEKIPSLNPKRRQRRSIKPHRPQQKLQRLTRSHAIPGISSEEALIELQQAAKQGDYGRVKEYMRVLVQERGQKPDAALYHAMISANTHPGYGSANEVKSLLQEMVEQDITPDAATYHAALKALSIHPDFLLRREILQELHQRWFTITPDGWHDIIAGLIRDRQIEVAMKNLEAAEKQGIEIETWLYDMIVYNLCSIREFDEALQIMQRRYFSSESSISQTLWYHLFDSASCALHHEVASFIWRSRVEPGYIKPSSGICINVLNTAARHGDTKLATAVFNTLNNRKHVIQLYHYEALLESWLAINDLKAAFTVLSAMQQSRQIAHQRPTEGSTRAIFHYLSDDYGRPAEALQCLQQLKDEGRPVPHAALNVVLEAYIHYNDLGSALEIYKSMHMIIPSGPNTSTFNTLFRGCTHARRKDLAMFLASEMLALNIPPNELTYDRLILVCVNALGEKDGGFEDAWRYFEEMRSMGWWPRMGTLKVLAMKGCEMSEDKVWQLVDHARGLDEEKMDFIMKTSWGRRVRILTPGEDSGNEANEEKEGRDAGDDSRVMEGKDRRIVDDGDKAIEGTDGRNIDNEFKINFVY